MELIILSPSQNVDNIIIDPQIGSMLFIKNRSGYIKNII